MNFHEFSIKYFQAMIWASLIMFVSAELKGDCFMFYLSVGLCYASLIGIPAFSIWFDEVILQLSFESLPYLDTGFEEELEGVR